MRCLFTFNPLGQPPGVACAQGITFIEVALSLAIMGIFAGFALVTMRDFSEDGDARMVESDQAMLQGILLQASDRLDTLPSNVNLNNVLNVMPPNPNRTLAVTAGGVSQTMTGSGRSAVFRVSGCGQLCLNSLSGFSKYTLAPTSQACSVDVTPCQTLRRS
jgi:type II secretory pathway pseudopilin PulG